MIRAALFVIAAVCFGCLIFTPIGWATALLAVCGAIPTIALIVLWRDPQEPRPVSPHFERAQALSTLDRLDGVGNRKASE